MDRTLPRLRDWIVRPLLALLAVAAVAAPVDDVIDTVNVQVGARDTVDATIRPAEERETYLIDLPRGATIKASAKRTSSVGPVPVIDVLDPDLDVISASPAAKPTKAPKVVTAQSGPHRVRVSGDGALDGDYLLKVRAGMPRSWSAASDTDLGAGEEHSFVFGAGAGAVATITLDRVGKSGFASQLVEITGPGGFVFVASPPASPSGRHRVKRVLLGGVGDYSVRFRNAGSGAGRWKLKISLKTPRASKTRIDLTDEVLAGEFAGEQAVFARSIDAAGGVVQPPPGQDALSGVSIDVPAVRRDSPSARRR